MRMPPMLMTALLIATAGVAQAADLPNGFVKGQGSAIVHVESGTKFPAEVAGFRRIGAIAFGGQQDYVGIAYRRLLDDGTQLSLRIAIVHIEGMTPQEHFLIAKPMALDGLSDVAVLSEGDYDRPGHGLDGYLGMFSARDGDQPVGIALWTFDRGYWDLRGRVEFPAGKQAETQRAVDAFVDAFVAAGQPYRTPEQ